MSCVWRRVDESSWMNKRLEGLIEGGEDGIGCGSTRCVGCAEEKDK